jgi:hypothetical protein
MSIQIYAFVRVHMYVCAFVVYYCVSQYGRGSLCAQEQNMYLTSILVPKHVHILAFTHICHVGGPLCTYAFLSHMHACTLDRHVYILCARADVFLCLNLFVF